MTDIVTALAGFVSLITIEDNQPQTQYIYFYFRICRRTCILYGGDFPLEAITIALSLCASVVDRLLHG